MINSLSKISLVVGLLGLLPTGVINAQVQMTRMPSRLEEALIDPNLGAILRRNARARQTSIDVPKRVTSFRRTSPRAPTYSNEPARFSMPKPQAIDNSKSVASKLPTLEQNKLPPTPIRKSPEIASIDKAAIEPTLAIKPSAAPEASDVPEAFTVPDAFTPLEVAATPKAAAAPEALDVAATVAPSDPIAPIEVATAPKAVTVPDETPLALSLGENAELEQPLAPIQGQLRFRVTGVSKIIEGEPTTMTIEVLNPTGYPIGPVEVNVKVPAELTITRFSKDAWLDTDRRIIAFELKRVPPGEIESIRMNGISQTPGDYLLDVALLSGKTMVAQRSVKTKVFPQQVARQQNFGDVEKLNTIQK